MDEIQTRLAENRLAKTSVWYMRAGGVCMLADTFIENAKVGKNGQVTIPQSIREILGVSNGDRITFIVENRSVRLINSAVYMIQSLQTEMAGVAEETRLTSYEVVMDLVKEVRSEKGV